MKFLILFACFAVAFAENYQGSQLFRITAKSQNDYKALQDLYFGGFVDFWIKPNMHGPTDIFALEYQIPAITNFLKAKSLTYEVMIPDVQKVIDDQKAAADSRRNVPEGRMTWTDYHRFDTIVEWVEEIAAAHPSTASVSIIGQSTEGRDIRIIKMGHEGENKPAIFLDAGIHAREWISPATATWMINEILTNPDFDVILQQVDFYIVPVANPDGYEFTHTNQRMWRKTRSQTPQPSCPGVDPNRNFAYEFGGPGTSDNPCSEIYKGPNAFSEPETKAIRDFIESNAATVNWTLYVALHSYAQMFLTPWGWTYDLPEHYPEMKELGLKAAESLQSVHNTRFQVGSVTELLSPGAGGSDDWAYGSNAFPYSYTLEIRDTGRYGFLLPPDQIIPSGEEVIQAFKTFANELPGIGKH